jgi:hypothetical protein
VTHSRGTIRFVCSNCIAPLEARRRQAGTRMRCPWCQTVLVVPQESRPDTPREMYALAEGKSPAPAAAPEPGLYVTCPVCHTRMHASADQVGQSLVCPDCGTSTVVPAPSQERPPPAPAPAVATPVEIYEVSKEEGQPLPTDREVYRLYIPVICSLCHTRMHATEEEVGQTVLCPDCGTRNVVPPPRETPGSQITAPEPQEGYRLAEPSAEPGQERPAGPRLYVYKCPTCLTRLHAGPGEAGDITICPDCSTKFRIPPPPEDWKWDPFQERTEIYDLATPVPMASAGQAEVPRAGRPEPPPGRTIEQELEERRSLFPKRERPRLPDWPFLQGVWTFPWYRTSRPCWLGLSGGALFLWYLFSEIRALAATGEGRAVYVAAIYGGVGLVAGLIYVVWAGLGLNLILTETANGADRIEDWAAGGVFDRIFDSLPFINSLALSGLMAWAIEKWVPGVPAGVGFAACGFVFFPVFVLSMFETGSVFGPISLKILGSLFRSGWGWVRFYFLSGTMFAALAGLAVGLYALVGAATGCFLAPLAAAAAMIYFRLLGRLGWYCTERSAGRS